MTRKEFFHRAVLSLLEGNYNDDYCITAAKSITRKVGEVEPFDDDEKSSTPNP